MPNHNPHARVRSTMAGIVLILACIGPLPSPHLALGASAPIAAGQAAPPPVIYLPMVSAPPSPVVETERGFGAVYYAAPSGSDSNPGTAAKPWKTLSKGISVLKAGDTLYIRSGTYRLASPLVITTSGGPGGGHITISTAPGERSLAVLTGDTNGDGAPETPSTSVHAALVELRGSHLHLENLQVASSKGRGVRSSGSHNVIGYNNIHHIWGNGIYVSGPDTILEKNTVWRAADSNYCAGAAGRRCNGTWPGGVAWGTTDSAAAPGAAPRIIIRGNTIYNNSGEGLLCMHTDYGLVEGNLIYDNWATNLDLDQCSHTTIRKNFIYATPNTLWWKYPTHPSTGILFSNEGFKDPSGSRYPIGHDRIVINNIITGAGYSFSFWNGDYEGGRLADSALKNDLIAYNTLVNTDNADSLGFNIDEGPHANTRIINNLVLITKNSVAWAGSTQGITFSHNLWSRKPPPAMASPADVVANPLLVDPFHPLTAGSALPEWYNLTGASPAIGSGLALSEVPGDFWGSPRSRVHPHIGASEYQP